MDERVVRPASSSSGGPPSPASFSATADDTVLEFLTSEVLEQWLLDDMKNLQPQQGLCAAAWSDGGGSAGLNGNTPQPEAAPRRRRDRRPLPRSSDGPVVSHVEAERQCRDMLHRRFYDLRAVVPSVSRMDKALLLADATAYISELRARVEQLEVEAAARQPVVAAASSSDYYAFDGLEEKLEVRMAGVLQVQHASICCLGGVTV